MANIRLIKRRIKSAGNIAQISKALELVSASKMKKAQAQALSGKLYAQKIYTMVLHLADKVSASIHPLLMRPEVLTGKRLAIVISSNKGLCGGLNNNLFRFILREYPKLNAYDFVSLGTKGSEFLARAHTNLISDFSDSYPFSNIVPAITELVSREFLAGKYDGVELVYNNFISALKQQPLKKSILPLTIEIKDTEKIEKVPEFKVEPNVKEVFNTLLPHYLENQIRDAILQAEASEHSARMIAMHNATDNAMTLTSELTLIYNKARQEKITTEISDIVTARIAVEG